MLLAEHIDLRLTLIGEGPDREALEKRVKENGLSSHIQFKGALNAEAVQNFYKQADVFVLTSFAEGLPVVLNLSHGF